MPKIQTEVEEKQQIIHLSKKVIEWNETWRREMMKGEPFKCFQGLQRSLLKSILISFFSLYPHLHFGVHFPENRNNKSQKTTNPSQKNQQNRVKTSQQNMIQNKTHCFFSADFEWIQRGFGLRVRNLGNRNKRERRQD